MKKLTENDVTGCVLIGSDNERYRYFAAVIGISKDGHHIVYSFDKLVKCFQDGSWKYSARKKWYYSRYPENWADKLGGIIRNF